MLDFVCADGNRSLVNVKKINNSYIFTVRFGKKSFENKGL